MKVLNVVADLAVGEWICMCVQRNYFGELTHVTVHSPDEEKCKRCTCDVETSQIAKGLVKK